MSKRNPNKILITYVNISSSDKGLKKKLDRIFNILFDETLKNEDLTKMPIKQRIASVNK